MPDSGQLELDDEEDTHFAMVLQPQLAGGRNVFHRMFGYANNIQDPVIEIEVMRRLGAHFYNDHKEEIQAGAKDWTLLFQVDSDLQFLTMWGDSGMLYFIIRNEDLAQGQFEETKFDFQCY